MKLIQILRLFLKKVYFLHFWSPTCEAREPKILLVLRIGITRILTPEEILQLFTVCLSWVSGPRHRGRKKSWSMIFLYTYQTFLYTMRVNKFEWIHYWHRVKYKWKFVNKWNFKYDFYISSNSFGLFRKYRVHEGLRELNKYWTISPFSSNRKSSNTWNLWHVCLMKSGEPYGTKNYWE